MKKTSLIVFVLLLVVSLQSCKTLTNKTHQINGAIKIDTLSFIDSNRDRVVPVAFSYLPKKEMKGKQKVVFLSHGYGENKGGAYLEYSYLTENLAKKGYFVVSIQHELPTDKLLAMDGNLQKTRLPNWQRGAENILFVLNKMKTLKPELDYRNLALIGHSNGGDMTVLFAHQHPQLVAKVISMDNRRMSLPRTSKPQIYTLRSDDYPADEGVLPNAEEQKKYGMTVEFIPVHHSNMDNDANFEERKLINNLLEKYLSE